MALFVVRIEGDAWPPFKVYRLSMNKVMHRAEERGMGEYGWLSTRYSFSFADWYDPSRMGFGALRVINDDRIAPHQGFGMHPHKDMEIVTFVTKGVLTHKDSMGNVGTIHANEVQVMSAGAGVMHSEYNDRDDPLELFQIWIEPKTLGITPRYAQRVVKEGERLLVGPEGASSALIINQDAYVYRIVLTSGGQYEHVLHSEAHGVYVLVVSGSLDVASEVLEARDALGVWNTEKVSLTAQGEVSALVFEVPISASLRGG